MKLFKETPVNDGYKTLQDDIKKQQMNFKLYTLTWKMWLSPI